MAAAQPCESQQANHHAESSVFMAVHFQAQRVGIAVYDAATQELQCMEALDDGHGSRSTEYGGHSLLDLAKLHYSPHVIFVSSKTDTQTINKLKEPLPTIDHNESTSPTGFQVCIERSGLFHPDQAHRCFESVYVTGMPRGLSSRDRLHRINTMVNLSCEQQVCAAGALLSILAREGLLASTDDGATTALPLSSLREASLDGFLVIDPASLEALHIFSEESHPSAMGIGQPKEGLSVFGCINSCVTPGGKKLLKLWLSRPLVDIDRLNERLDAVEYLTRDTTVIDTLKTALRRVKDPIHQLQQIQATQTMPQAEMFLQLQGMLSAQFRIRDILEELLFPPHSTDRYIQTPGNSLFNTATDTGHQPQSISALFRIGSSIDDNLVACHNLIATVIDPDQAPDGMLVHYGVSEELDSTKHLYFGLPDLLTRVVQEELNRIPRSMISAVSDATWSITYMPQVGFIIKIEGHRIPESLLCDTLADYEFAFESSGEEALPCWYYRSESTRELNERFGDILHRIKDLESSVCAQLISHIIEFIPSIRQASEAISELDCLLSLATAARELNLTRPKITTGTDLHIKAGRHLLTELLVDRFIPNDTDMTASKVHIITGPNFSGKSVYAKQIALITFLAHVGSFVPAEEGAVIGLTDRIFTRIASRESLAIPQSAFMIDLSQIASMIRLSTPRSLCIIDEFGKGTLSSDGIGLLCSVLKHFATGSDTPRVVLCTHFTEVLDDSYLPRHPQLSFHTMSVFVQGHELIENDAMNEQAQPPLPPEAISDLVFLYRLIPGTVAPSFGLYCAKLAGVNQDIVKRAAELVTCQQEPSAAFSYPAMAADVILKRRVVFQGLIDKLAAANLESIDECKDVYNSILSVAAGL